jgi:hypothetical protein
MNLITPKWTDTPGWWPRIEGWIEKAIMYGGGVTIFPRDVYDGLMNRNMKLWLAVSDEGTPHACCVTQMVTYPRMRLLHILVVAGREHGMQNWIHFVTEIEKFARTLDCEGMEFGGRGGWTRTMIEYGFEPVYTLHRRMF